MTLPACEQACADFKLLIRSRPAGCADFKFSIDRVMTEHVCVFCSIEKQSCLLLY